jgi:NAD(P)-dependent dehydrogenase (short-subunit alcohol dehydrogenase family)
MVVKVVMVTGASGGVGAGIATACGVAGMEVWVAARREEASKTVAAEVDAAGGRGRVVVCDVASASSVRAAVAGIVASAGRLDAVVHNATSAHSSQSTPLGSISMEALEDHVRVSLRGSYNLASDALPHLAHSKGSFVFLTSEAGFEGKRLLAAYAMVKAAQRGLMRVLAREWGPRGVRVNAVAPLASTPAMERAFASDPSMQRRVLDRIPLGRLGDSATDIGPAVRFLIDEDASFVTGQTLMVDGGSCPIT